MELELFVPRKHSNVYLMHAFNIFRLHLNSLTAYSMVWRFSNMAMALPREVDYCTAPPLALNSLLLHLIGFETGPIKVFMPHLSTSDFPFSYH